MAERVVIAPTTRNEGHGKFVLEVDDAGIVKKGHFMSLVLVRGFERFIVGREMQFAPIATSRFCGLCPPTHATASSEAIERSLGIAPPKAGLLLRELCNIGNHLHDHPLQYILVMPDFIKDTAVITECIARIQRMRKIGQYFCDVIGGEAIHSPHIRIGGMARNISEPARRKMLETLDEYERLAAVQRDIMLTAYDAADVPEGLGAHDLELMSTDLIYGDADVFIKEYYPRYSEVLPIKYYGEDPGIEASTVIPLLGRHIVEVGPRARLSRFRGYHQKGCMAINRARPEEISIRVERAREILRDIDTNADTFTKALNVGDDSLGIGVNEAPRGTNVHMVRVKDRKITFYKAMPATMWNIPVIGKATEGFHHRWALWVMRAYDPCISCATHVIVLNEGNVVCEYLAEARP